MSTKYIRTMRFQKCIVNMTNVLQTIYASHNKNIMDLFIYAITPQPINAFLTSY